MQLQITANKVSPISAVALAICRDKDAAARHLDDSREAMAVLKAAQGPASTTEQGWAAELVRRVVLDFVTQLPDSVLAQLTALALPVDAVANETVYVPPRNLSSEAAAWVGEGQAIPVFSGLQSGAEVSNKKVAAIACFTRELVQSSNAPAVVDAALREAVARRADATLLSADAATAGAPGGMFADATPGTGTDSAMGDCKTLYESVSDATRGAFIMNGSQYIGASAAGIVDAQGLIARCPVVVSSRVPLGVVAFVDAADFCVSAGADVAVALSGDAAVHMNDAAAPIVGEDGTLAAPTTSLWQISAVGIRVVLPAAWAWRASGRVAVLENCTW
ncbi:phage major capsid protein [Cupriavidus oxalaticus]|nr:phage major capsid protein [Cupriavidus oxalaticus]